MHRAGRSAMTAFGLGKRKRADEGEFSSSEPAPGSPPSLPLAWPSRKRARCTRSALASSREALPLVPNLSSSSRQARSARPPAPPRRPALPRRLSHRARLARARCAGPDGFNELLASERAQRQPCPNPSAPGCEGTDSNASESAPALHPSASSSASAGTGPAVSFDFGGFGAGAAFAFGAVSQENQGGGQSALDTGAPPTTHSTGLTSSATSSTTGSASAFTFGEAPDGGKLQNDEAPAGENAPGFRFGNEAQQPQQQQQLPPVAFDFTAAGGTATGGKSLEQGNAAGSSTSGCFTFGSGNEQEEGKKRRPVTVRRRRR